MTRLLVVVEGQAEESFVNNVLAPELRAQGYASVSARIMGNARQRSSRGGIKPWPAVRDELLRHLREDRTVAVTTMVDFYGLPRSGQRAWPGSALTPGPRVEDLARAIEGSLEDEIGSLMGDSFNRARFVPFVVMHEFEGLLFSDCHAFSASVGRPDLMKHLQAIRDEFATPEEINDDPDTHPSRRIQNLFRGYQKPLHGTLAAQAIGIQGIREACPHFRGWLDRLERLLALA